MRAMLVMCCCLLFAGGRAAAGAAAPGDKSAEIDALFRECAQPGAPGASVIVIRDGRAAFRKSYGLADVERRVRATPATNYRLASVTKQFTAMAVMILADRPNPALAPDPAQAPGLGRGKLSFQQHLTDFFPDLPPWAREVTVRQMLNHQSGLPDYEDMVPKETPEVVTSPARQLKDRDVLGFLKKQKRLLFEPGTQYHYSNTGYVVLGLLIEKLSGLSYTQFLKQNIFEPLGMKETVAHVEGVTRVRSRAYGYSKKSEAFVRTDQSPTSATLGDGGVYSSVDDLMKWDQALYAAAGNGSGQKLVKPETFQQAITPAPLAGGKPTSYGFGWEVGKFGSWFQMAHSGTTLGFRTYILRVPEKSFSVIVLANRSDLRPAELATRIAALYLGE